MNTEETISFIKKTLSKMQITFEEDYEFAATGIDGKIYNRVFAFKIGTGDNPLYVDFYPEDCLKWYDENEYVAKTMIADETANLCSQTGIRVILVAENQNKRITQKALKEAIKKIALEQIDKVIDEGSD